jgi:[ribosomal protein S5]-alanine N-acetyltransferase
MAGRIVAETERLILREFDEGDVEPFYRLGSDPAVTRFTGDRLTDRAHAQEILRSHPLADYQAHGFGRWACVLRSSGAVIGFAGLKYLAELDDVDLGYRFLPSYWGQGLATEAGAAALSFGFDHLRLEHVLGLVDRANVASRRVLEKLGFTYEGEIDFRGDRVLKSIVRRDGRP